jgi:hypothetical protein
MSTPEPDRSYRIDAAQRALIRPGVDVAALEELLQYFPDESREGHLAMFQLRTVVADSEGRVPDVAMLERISDPVMQDLLERARGWRDRPPSASPHPRRQPPR